MKKETTKLCVGGRIVLNLRDSSGQVAGRITRLSAEEGRFEIDKKTYYLTDFEETLELKPTSEDLYLVVRRKQRWKYLIYMI